MYTVVMFSVLARYGQLVHSSHTICMVDSLISDVNRSHNGLGQNSPAYTVNGPLNGFGQNRSMGGTTVRIGQ